jgi:hypothetical protein
MDSATSQNSKLILVAMIFAASIDLHRPDDRLLSLSALFAFGGRLADIAAIGACAPRGGCSVAPSPPPASSPA